MTENVQIDETAGTDVNDALVTEYTSESDTAVAGEAVQRPRATAPGAATGRRKQAVARVRIVPGTGEWTINGRTLLGYFPNKVHQQIVNEPLSLLELDGAYDVLSTCTVVAPPARPAPCAWVWPARSTASTRS